MKKLFAFLLSMVMVFSMMSVMAACKGPEIDNEDKKQDKDVAADTSAWSTEPGEVIEQPFTALFSYFRGRMRGEITWETGPGDVIMQPFEVDETQEGDETYQVVNPEDVVWGEVETIDSQDVVNILLIGNDAQGSGRARSDAIILVSMNKMKNQIQLTSFMRDLYVQIPGYEANRINAAYALGGPELLDATLEKNFGIVVDGNVEINFEAFEEAIDILGGVDVEVTNSEANYMNGHYGYALSEGVNHMDGEVALHFVRIRKFGNGDYDRTERQRRLITTVVNSLKDSDILDIIELIYEVLPYVYTDLNDSEIMSYVTTALDILSSGSSMGSMRIPADDAHYMASIRGMTVMVPDLEMCQEDLRESIYYETIKEPNETPELSLNIRDLTLLSEGETATITLGSGIPVEQCTWNSAVESVATVINGKVTAVAPGVTRITVEFNGQIETCIVRCSWEEETEASEVTPNEDMNYSLSHSEVTILVGESFTLLLHDSKGDAAEVKWTVNSWLDGGNVSIQGNTITGVTSGTCTVSCTYSGMEYKCIVHIC